MSFLGPQASIASSLSVGYRRPLEPSLKDGVVVLLAAAANHSQELLSLDQETSPLRKMPSCPRDFKRTSVERHFRYDVQSEQQQQQQSQKEKETCRIMYDRAKGFGMDWCEFRLMRLDEEDGEYYELGFVKPDPLEENSIIPQRVRVALMYFIAVIPENAINATFFTSSLRVNLCNCQT